MTLSSVFVGSAVPTKCAQDGRIHLWKGSGKKNAYFDSVKKKQKKAYTSASVHRVAALMEGAKPKTGSVNTFGERVSGCAASRRPG